MSWVTSIHHPHHGRGEGYLYRHGLQRGRRPQVELAKYNFTKLNTEEGATRPWWTDSFYITKGDEDPKNDAVLLRSRDQPMQVRTMEL